MSDSQSSSFTKPEGIIVTIDGPAGSGKTSTARKVAKIMKYRHLDSGALYRAATFALLQESVPVQEWEHLTVDDLGKLDLVVVPKGDRIIIFWKKTEISSALRTVEVTARVSHVAGLSQVRKWLLGTQRHLGTRGRLVADGRDMGETVFPDAEVKIFLTASLEVRARRRLLENSSDGFLAKILRDEMEKIRERDSADQGRRHSPLVQAKDAIEVNTTDLSFDKQVEVLLRIIRDLTGTC